MMKLKLPFTGSSRGRYAPVAMGMQPVGGVLASPSGMDDDDPHRFDDRFHDAQTPKRFTVLNRPSRTRSWLLVLFCVALIGMGMVIWSGWQPLDWDFKKLRLPGFDTDSITPGHPHAPPPPSPHKPVESIGGLDVVAPTGEDTAMDFSSSDSELSSGKAAHEYGYQPAHDEDDDLADHEDLMDHADYGTDHTDEDTHGDADMYGHTSYDANSPTSSTDHEPVTDLYGDDGSHTSGSHADSDHDALFAGKEGEHEVTDLYGDDGSHTSGSHSESDHDALLASEEQEHTTGSHEGTDLYGDDGTYSASHEHDEEHGPLSPAVEPTEDEDEESAETKYHLDHSGLTDSDTDASATLDHENLDPEDDPDLDSAYPTHHADLDAAVEPDHEVHEVGDDLHDDHFAPSSHSSAPHPGTVGSSSHDTSSLSHSSDHDSDFHTEVEGEDRVDPNVDGLREEAQAGGFPEPEPNSRSVAGTLGEQAESTFERRAKALFWFA